MRASISKKINKDFLQLYAPVTWQFAHVPWGNWKSFETRKFLPKASARGLSNKILAWGFEMFAVEYYSFIYELQLSIKNAFKFGLSIFLEKKEYMSRNFLVLPFLIFKQRDRILWKVYTNKGKCKVTNLAQRHLHNSFVACLRNHEVFVDPGSKSRAVTPTKIL